VRVDAFLALLAESLLEIWTDSVGRVIFLIGILHAFQSVDVFVERIE